jgi:hypothetical protein
MRDALSLINRQKAEIEALIAGQETLQKYIAEQKAEIERLRGMNHRCVYYSDEETTEYCVDGPCQEHKTLTELKAEIKAEAIKEFAERAKNDIEERLSEKIKSQNPDLYLIHKIINNLVKEMVGE